MRRGVGVAFVVLAAFGLLCQASEWMDKFDGALEAGWQWVRESGWNWGLTESAGSLRITTQRGGLLFDANNARNLLIRDAPSGDYVIQTHVVFEPTEDYQIAGLLVYGDDDNFLLLGRAYCGACGGSKIYFDYEEGGKPLGGYSIETSSRNRAYLKITRQGSTYSGYYREEDGDWTLVARYNRVGIQAQGVGLATGDGNRGAAQINADFAYFLLVDSGVAGTPPGTASDTAGYDELLGAAYAARVVECMDCRPICDPKSILGPPCPVNQILLEDCWLGVLPRGFVIVEMERPFVDGPGADLLVYELEEGNDASRESFSVYVSLDGEDWVRVANDVEATEGRPHAPLMYAAIDLDGRGGAYRFVKIVASANQPRTEYRGPEMLAVKALYTVAE